jgi:hypothetical protein
MYLLTRTLLTDIGIFSDLSKDGIHVCVVAEHAYESLPKIPDGTYQCIRRKSPKFGFEVFLVEDVPGCDFIEVHMGNYPQKDSDGCMLLGDQVLDREMVSNSRETFDKFMASLEGVDSFQLTVVTPSTAT